MAMWWDILSSIDGIPDMMGKYMTVDEHGKIHHFFGRDLRGTFTNLSTLNDLTKEEILKWKSEGLEIFGPYDMPAKNHQVIGAGHNKDTLVDLFQEMTLNYPNGDMYVILPKFRYDTHIQVAVVDSNKKIKTYVLGRFPIMELKSALEFLELPEWE